MKSTSAGAIMQIDSCLEYPEEHYKFILLKSFTEVLDITQLRIKFKSSKREI